VDCTSSAPPASPLPGLSLTTDLAIWLLFWPLIFGLRLFWFQHRHFDFWLGYILGLFGFRLGYILGFFGFGLDHLGVMMNSAINGVLHMSHHGLDLIHQSLDLTLGMMELLLQGLGMMDMTDMIGLMNMLHHRYLELLGHFLTDTADSSSPILRLRKTASITERSNFYNTLHQKIVI
jgi:hypothetical protein